MHHVAIVRVSCVKPNCLNDLVCSVNSYMFQFLFLRHRHFLEYAAVSQYLPSVWCGFVISVCVLCLVSSRLVCQTVHTDIGTGFATHRSVTLKPHSIYDTDDDVTENVEKRCLQRKLLKF